MTKYSMTIRLGNVGDLRVEADTMDEFTRIIENELRNLRETAMSVVEKDRPIAEVKVQYPTIAEPGISRRKAVEKLLSTDYGENPRTLDELHSALSFNAIHATKEALGSLLSKMTKKGILGRVKKNDVYAYYLRRIAN